MGRNVSRPRCDGGKPPDEAVSAFAIHDIIAQLNHGRLDKAGLKLMGFAGQAPEAFEALEHCRPFHLTPRCSKDLDDIAHRFAIDTLPQGPGLQARAFLDTTFCDKDREGLAKRLVPRAEVRQRTAAP